MVVFPRDLSTKMGLLKLSVCLFEEIVTSIKWRELDRRRKGVIQKTDLILALFASIMRTEGDSFSETCVSTHRTAGDYYSKEHSLNSHSFVNPEPEITNYCFHVCAVTAFRYILQSSFNDKFEFLRGSVNFSNETHLTNCYTP
jgi:hypothetical protein